MPFGAAVSVAMTKIKEAVKRSIKYAVPTTIQSAVVALLMKRRRAV
jgi:hypothetical protein